MRKIFTGQRPNLDTIVSIYAIQNLINVDKEQTQVTFVDPTWSGIVETGNFGINLPNAQKKGGEIYNSYLNNEENVGYYSAFDQVLSVYSDKIEKSSWGSMTFFSAFSNPDYVGNNLRNLGVDVKQQLHNHYLQNLYGGSMNTVLEAHYALHADEEDRDNKVIKALSVTLKGIRMITQPSYGIRKAQVLGNVLLSQQVQKTPVNA